MLIISQERWHTADMNGLATLVEAAIADTDPGDCPVMCMLPLGESDWHELPAEDDVTSGLGALARRPGIYIAAAAPVVAEKSGQAQTIGWVIAPDGSCALRSAKISPDFLEGFTDSTCELGKPADLPVAETPFGRTAMLVGEDIFSAQYARVAVYAGAELILNPGRELRDAAFESRQRARATRAYENTAYVAVARRHGARTAMPTPEPVSGGGSSQAQAG